LNQREFKEHRPEWRLDKARRNRALPQSRGQTRAVGRASRLWQPAKTTRNAWTATSWTPHYWYRRSQAGPSRLSPETRRCLPVGTP